MACAPNLCFSVQAACKLSKWFTGRLFVCGPAMDLLNQMIFPIIAPTLEGVIITGRFHGGLKSQSTHLRRIAWLGCLIR